MVIFCTYLWIIETNFEFCLSFYYKTNNPLTQKWVNGLL